MKIAVVSEFFYPHSGGQEQRLLEILEYVAKQGHKVDVYTIKYDEDLSDQENYNEINILRVIKNKNYIGGGGLKSRSLKTIIQYSLKVASRLGANSYDKVIFSQFPIFHMLLTCFTKSKKILDFVEYRHGRFWEFLFGLEMKCADQVVCISDVVKEKALKIPRRYLQGLLQASFTCPTYDAAREYDEASCGASSWTCAYDAS